MAVGMVFLIKLGISSMLTYVAYMSNEIARLDNSNFGYTLFSWMFFALAVGA